MIKESIYYTSFKETLNKSIHTPLSDGFSRRGIDG